MTPKIIRRAVLVAIVVGSVLNLINSYDVFWASDYSAKNIMRIALTYITPFCVSMYSSIHATKQ